MQIELFEEFVVLAKELNFHRAARRLNITQSTLSKHIAVLEREYGIKLFNRDRSGVTLTSNGATLLESAQAIVDAYTTSKKLFAPSEGNRKTLFVGGELGNPAAFDCVSEAVGLFTRQHPGNPVHFVPCTSIALESQLEQLRTGEIDCSVFKLDRHALSLRPDTDDFECIQLCRVPVDAVVSPTNPLAQKGSLVLSDLTGCTLVRLIGPHFSPAWKPIERQLKSSGIPYQTVPVAVSSTYDFFNLDLGASVLLMPRLSLRRETFVRNGLQVIPISRDELHVELYTLYLRGRQPSLVESFSSALSEALSSAL